MYPTHVLDSGKILHKEFYQRFAPVVGKALIEIGDQFKISSTSDSFENFVADIGADQSYASDRSVEHRLDRVAEPGALRVCADRMKDEFNEWPRHHAEQNLTRACLQQA